MKTLKDICNGLDVPERVDVEFLRDAAIEWVKLFEIENLASPWTQGNTKKELTILISWIKYFFNITEEDLK